MSYMHVICILQSKEKFDEIIVWNPSLRFDVVFLPFALFGGALYLVEVNPVLDLHYLVILPKLVVCQEEMLAALRKK